MDNTVLVRDLMLKDVKTVDQSTSVLDASKLMSKCGIGALIVLDGEKHTAGIFTERDLLMKVVAKGVSLDTPLHAVMTKNLVCVQLHDTMSAVPELMIKGGFRHVPVVDGFEPVGILSIRDVLKFALK